MKRRPQTRGRTTGGKTFEQAAEDGRDVGQYVTHGSAQGDKIGWPLNNGLRGLM
jgi:hypothetical protein